MHRFATTSDVADAATRKRADGPSRHRSRHFTRQPPQVRIASTPSRARSFPSRVGRRRRFLPPPPRHSIPLLSSNEAPILPSADDPRALLPLPPQTTPAPSMGKPKKMADAAPVDDDDALFQQRAVELKGARRPRARRRPSYRRFRRFIYPSPRRTRLGGRPSRNRAARRDGGPRARRRRSILRSPRARERRARHRARRSRAPSRAASPRWTAVGSKSSRPRAASTRTRRTFSPLHSTAFVDRAFPDIPRPTLTLPSTLHPSSPQKNRRRREAVRRAQVQRGRRGVRPGHQARRRRIRGGRGSPRVARRVLLPPPALRRRRRGHDARAEDISG